MDKTSSKNNHQLKRHERLINLYRILTQLVIHEGRFISERTNNFLIFNSFLFAGFLLLSIQLSNIGGWIITLEIILSFVGLAMCLLHSISITHTINAADFWRSSIGLIENDPDFWYPTKVEKDADLDIFKARKRYLDGIQTRQEKDPIELSQPPSFMKRLYSHFHGPNRIFVFAIPSFIGILWLIALFWSFSQLIHPT